MEKQKQTEFSILKDKGLNFSGRSINSSLFLIKFAIDNFTVYVYMKGTDHSDPPSACTSLLPPTTLFPTNSVHKFMSIHFVLWTTEFN